MASEARRRSGRIISIRAQRSKVSAAGAPMSRRSGMHVLILQYRDLALQQSVLASEFSDLRGSGKGSLDPVALNCILKFLEFSSTVIEVLLQRSILILEIAFDSPDACFEGNHDAFDMLDRKKKGPAEGGEHRGDHFQCGNAAIDETVLVLPIGTTGC